MPNSLYSNARARDCSSNILVVILTLASVFMATTVCGGSLPTGDPPFKLDWHTSTSEVVVGDSYTLTVRMYDVREASEHGGISASFPLRPVTLTASTILKGLLFDGIDMFTLADPSYRSH